MTSTLCEASSNASRSAFLGMAFICIHRLQPEVTGGKTGAAFHLSHDERFLLKALNKAEFDKLLGDATNLFWYFDKARSCRLTSGVVDVRCSMNSCPRC